MPSPPGPRPPAAVVLLAAGEGRRVGAERNKVLLPLAGEPVLAWSLRRVRELGGVASVVVVVRKPDRTVVSRILEEVWAGSEPAAEVLLVTGGDTRHASERHALKALASRIERGEVEVVAIHDTARPLAGTGLFERTITEAHRHGGALPVVEQCALLPREATGAGGGGARLISGQSPASAQTRLVAVQTPQAFRARELLAAYQAAERDGFEGTDTAATVERYTDLQVRCVPSDAANLKITFPEDVALAERLVARLGPR